MEMSAKSTGVHGGAPPQFNLVRIRVPPMLDGVHAGQQRVGACVGEHRPTARGDARESGGAQDVEMWTSWSRDVDSIQDFAK